jgi:hypothetical protein
MNLGYIIGITYIISFIILFLNLIIVIFSLITDTKLKKELGMYGPVFTIIWNIISILSRVAIFLITFITIIIIFCWFVYLFLLVLVTILKKSLIFAPLGCKIYKNVMKLPLMTDFKKLGFFAILNRIAKGKNLTKPISNFIYLNIMEPIIEKYPKYKKQIKKSMYFPDDILEIEEICDEDFENENSKNNNINKTEIEKINNIKKYDFEQCKRSKYLNITPDMNNYQIDFLKLQNQFIDAQCEILNSIK